MNISILNNSVRVSVDIDTDAAVNAIATNAAMLTYSVTKFVLDRAVEDTHKVYNEVSKVASVVTDKAKKDIDTVITAGRNSGIIVENKLNNSYDVAKATVIEAIADTQVTRDGVIAATQVKVAKATDSRVVKPTEEFTAQVVAPIKAKVAQIEKAIADYTKLEEVEAIAQEIVPSNAIAVQNEIKEGDERVSPSIAQETPQVIGGALVSSAGVTSLDTVDTVDTVAEEQTQAIATEQKAATNLSEMIREEAAKH